MQDNIEYDLQFKYQFTVIFDYNKPKNPQK